MKVNLRKIIIGLSWVYASVIVIWFVLYLLLGDSVWWLALLNSFVPFFFIPVILILPFSLIYHSPIVWLSLCFPVLIFVGLYGNLFLPVWNRHTISEPLLTIMTFNVWGGSQHIETAQVIIDNGYPDIVALQELSPEMEDVLFEVVGDYCPYHLIEVAEGYRGMAVLSRYPLREVSDVSQLHALDWIVQIFEVEVDDQVITVYNCHPHSSNILVYLEEGTAIAENVEAGFRNREMIVGYLIADIESRDTPVIVVGDFNSSDRSEVYRILSARLEDSHLEAGWGFGHTFPAYQGSYHGIPIFARQMRLDWIFHTQELQALRSVVGETYGESDHLPVIVDLVKL